MPLLRTLLISLFSALPLCTHAAVLESLYQVQVPPAEGAQQSVQLDTATRVMLQRLAGPDVVLDKGPLAAIMAEPSKVTRQIGALDDQGGMRVEFDPVLLRDALAQADVPMLGRNRPGVLVWAVQTSPLGEDFLSSGGEMGQALRAAAAYRGVALTQPLADLQDRTSVAEADILKADQTVLSEASKRYPAEGVLALQAQQGEESWALQWTFWLNDKASTGKAQAADPWAAADELMQALAQAVFEQYAVTSLPSDQLTGWRLHISGVNSLEQFSRLQRMLQQMGTQATPQLVSMRGDEVIFTFDFPGDESQLQRMLMLDQRLVSVEPPAQPAEIPMTNAAVPAGPAAAETGSEPMEQSATQTATPETADADAPLAAQNAAADKPQDLVPAAPADNRKSLYYRWR
ncbi:MAG: DUF2066 domain-containing protein [Halopseudomonas sp.]|uniref:DUF2066 domain-containing protein n=1 Tax=Halopseudomonas sp. TaxID=2901191 RepID=UPI003001EA03